MSDVNLSKPTGLGSWLAIYRLYLSAFPRAERKPFWVICRQYREGKFDVWMIRRDGDFAGFATTVNGSDLILLDYLAVEKAVRGTGIGTAALEILQQKYSGKGLFLEIESTLENAPDQAMRLRRKQFYLAAGLVDLQVQAELFGVNMELLGIRCSMDYESYHSFYRENLGPWAAEHVRPVHP